MYYALCICDGVEFCCFVLRFRWDDCCYYNTKGDFVDNGYLCARAVCINQVCLISLSMWEAWDISRKGEGDSGRREDWARLLR